MPTTALHTKPWPRSNRGWHLPPQGMAVFESEGEGDAARLSHYFLPPLILQGKRILFLDGANCANPRLMARLAQQRNISFGQFSRQIKIARAFTCFQLTELLARVPQYLTEFPAQILIVTAFPELYFDEDVRDWNARMAFERGLSCLRRLVCPVPRVVAALFCSPSRFRPPVARRRFFAQTCAAATEIWKFQPAGDGKLGLSLQTRLGREREAGSGAANALAR